MKMLQLFQSVPANYVRMLLICWTILGVTATGLHRQDAAQKSSGLTIWAVHHKQPRCLGTDDQIRIQMLLVQVAGQVKGWAEMS